MSKTNLNAILEELSKVDDNQNCFDCSKLFIYKLPIKNESLFKLQKTKFLLLGLL